MKERHETWQAVLQDLKGLISYHEIIGVREFPLTPLMENFLSGKDVSKRSAEVPGQSAAESLAGVRASLEGCESCTLQAQRTRIVFGQGNNEADLMIIADWPTEKDDASGELFSGADGELLDKMLAAIGLSRTQIYLTGLVKCFPGREKIPGQEEIDACLSFLKRQIESVNPKVICAMGPHATRILLHTDEQLFRLRGRFHAYRLQSGQTIHLMPTFHPAFLLQNEEMKRPCWQDLLMIQRALGMVSNS